MSWLTQRARKLVGMRNRMTTNFDIRHGTTEDMAAIGALYRATLAGEDLSALLDELLANRDDVLSLVATSGETLVGHIAITACGVEGRETRVALLGPLAVLPERQRGGIGHALIGEGCKRLKTDAMGNVTRVLVLGDPNYYGRFGFASETTITPPYPLVPEWRTAWQALSLTDDAGPLHGKLVVPEPWMHASLWSPS